MKQNLIVLCALVVSGAISTPQTTKVGNIVTNSDTVSNLVLLKDTLSRFYPIEHWTMSTSADALHPFAPRFCWNFFRPSPEAVRGLSEALSAYESSVRWIFGPPSARAMCIVAVRPGAKAFVGYPPIEQTGVLFPGRPIEQQFVATKDFIDQALADIPHLCSFLERRLGLERLPSKSFDPRWIAPTDPPSLETIPFDFVERGMHVAMVIPRNSAEKKILHFSVTQEEWRAISAGVLDNGSQEDSRPRLNASAFPLLSTIQETESTYFKESEVAGLREECIRARTHSTSLAIRGLDKLIMLCDWAKHLRGDLVLSAP